MIQVIATIKARDGQRQRLLDAFGEILTEVRAKAGCRQYTLGLHLPSGMPGQAPSDPSEFVIVEQWDNLAALQAHIADPAYQAWYLERWHCVEGASMQIFELLA
jgi:quinol monooxygenase YgiN